MYADPNGLTKVECSVDEEADDFDATNEENTAPKEEEIIKKSVSVTITLDGDDEEVMDTSKDNPFCDLQYLYHEDSDNNNGTDAALLSGDKSKDDTVAPMEHVLKAGSQGISKEPQMTSADLSDCRPISCEKFARYLRAHNIPDIRAPSVPTSFPVEGGLFNTGASMNFSNVLRECFEYRQGFWDDIVVRDNTIQLNRGERVSVKKMLMWKKKAMKRNLLGKIKKKEKKESRVSTMLAVRKTRNEGPAAVDGESVEEPDIQILYDSARSVNEVTNGATVQAKKHGKQAIEDNGENDLTQRNPRNVANSIVALSKGSNVSSISESGVIVNGGEELLAAEVQEPSLCENAKAAPQLSQNKIGSSLDPVIHGTVGSSSTLVLPTNWDQIAASNEVFLENTVNSVFPINKEVLKMASEVEKSSDFDPTVKDSSVEQSSALEEVSAVGKEDFGSEKGDNNTKKENDDSAQGLKVSPPKEDDVEIISDDQGDLRQSEGSDGTVVLDDDDNLSDLVVIDEFDEDDGVEIVAGKPGRAWRMIEMEKGPSSTKTGLFVHYKLSPHDGQPREPVIHQTSNFTTRIPLEPASVPPPVSSDLGATMFGVPLDHSILNSGTNPLDSVPFLVPELESASTAARNERKRPVDQENAKRRQLSERLGVSDELWKPKTYKPVSGLTMEDQLAFNNRPHITDRERNLQAMGVIEDYGVLPRNEYQFPFDPYAGLYWPVFQPFDDVDLNHREETDAADVRNQLTDLTICNFIAKKELLCDADPGGWAKSFKEADRMTEAEREKNGRFANRVGYARKINNQNIKDARESDEKKQREHEARLKELEKMEAETRSYGVDHGGNRLKATEDRIRSMRMQDHVRENIVDEYSSVKTRHGNRKISQLPSYWFKVPREQYIPANDRRTFLCEFTNHFNMGVVSFLNNLTMGGTELPSADAILYGLQKTVIEANYFHLMSARYQLRLGDMDLIYSKKRQKALEQKFPIGSKVKIEELREFAKLHYWEHKYWTLIWDSLASAYKNIPPVSLLINDILKPVDKAFLQLAGSGHREEYHRIYRDHKEEYLRRTSTGRRF